MSSLPPPEWQEYVRLGIDYGTGYLKLATQYIYPGRNDNATDIFDVFLDHHNSASSVAIEQVAIWPDGHRLIWGKRPVDRWNRDHPHEQKVLLSAWKLALITDFRDREVVQSTVDALGCGKDYHSVTSAVQDVITEHLRQIKSEVLKWCKEKSPASMSRTIDWDKLPWEAQIAVPAMWSAEANGVMSKSAYKAGFNHVNLREEPQCVAGACMSELRGNGQVDEYAQVLFLDVGAGTSDAAVVRFRCESKESTRMILERVGPSQGNDGGSLAVNNASWKSFVEHPTVREEGGVAEFCRRLNITQVECQRQLSVETDRIKSQYDAENVFPYTITINGIPTPEFWSVGSTHIGFESDVVHKWHDDWVDLNEDLLDKIIVAAPDCRRAVFTGRGADNSYLRSRLTVKLKSHKIQPYDLRSDYPCSRGALQHYLFEEDQPTFSNATFFTTQFETFNLKVHTDIARPTKKRRTVKARKRVPSSVRKQAQRYRWDPSELVVEERLVRLMDIVDNEPVNIVRLPMQFDIDASIPARIHFDIYSTTQPQLHKPHGPLKDANGNLFDDFTPYPIAFLDLPDLSQHFDPPTNIAMYEVCGFVEMRKIDTTLMVLVTLLGQDFAWQYDEKGAFAKIQDYNPSQVIYQKRQRIWNSSCSSFVKGNVTDAQMARLDDTAGVQPQADSNTGTSDVVPESHEDATLVIDRRPSRLIGKRSRDQTKGMSRNVAMRRYRGIQNVTD